MLKKSKDLFCPTTLGCYFKAHFYVQFTPPCPSQFTEFHLSLTKNFQLKEHPIIIQFFKITNCGLQRQNLKFNVHLMPHQTGIGIITYEYIMVGFFCRFLHPIAYSTSCFDSFTPDYMLHFRLRQFYAQLKDGGFLVRFLSLII